MPPKQGTWPNRVTTQLHWFLTAHKRPPNKQTVLRWSPGYEVATEGYLKRGKWYMHDDAIDEEYEVPTPLYWARWPQHQDLPKQPTAA